MMTLFEGPARTLYPMLALGPLLLLLFSVACGSAAAPTSLPTSTPSLAKAPQPSSIILPTTTPAMTPISPTVSGRDAITLVVSDEPVTLDAFSAQCTGTPELFPCGDYSMDTLTYISEETREVIPLSATEKWEQVAPDRWRFTLRQGVKFHNGEPFDSAAAKYAIDLEGNAPECVLHWPSQCRSSRPIYCGCSVRRSLPHLSQERLLDTLPSPGLVPGCFGSPEERDDDRIWTLLGHRMAARGVGEDGVLWSIPGKD
jgi:hypothetical protein